MKKGTEAIIKAAQNQALRTNWIKHRTDKQDMSLKCRICQTEDESAMHLASSCEGLAKQQYKVRHDAVKRSVYWEICRKYGIECSRKWYQLQIKVMLRCYGMWKLMERSDTTDWT